MAGVRVRVLPISKDLRGPEELARWAAIEQERADQALEALWRKGVRENVRARTMARFRRWAGVT